MQRHSVVIYHKTDFWEGNNDIYVCFETWHSLESEEN